MKKLTLMLASVLALSTASVAHENGYITVNSYADAFVFDELGVTFSVYPDGEFDFYLPQGQVSNTVSNGYVTATFNSGYNVDPYVQYDDFGAVIQVENVPIYYDYYGRVSQIGDVFISYRNRRVCQVGGLYVYYNSYGHYAYHTGFINTWNPYFVYRPFYVGFCRPRPNLCFVSYNPYRQYYSPIRYTYYRPYVTNVRPCIATIGHTYRPSGYGVVHHRYTQTPGRGEQAVVRSRRTVTTADASPRPAYNGNAVDRGQISRQSTGTSAASRPAAERPSVNSRPATSRVPEYSSRPVERAPQRTPSAQAEQSRVSSSSYNRGASTVNRQPSNVVRQPAATGRVSSPQTTRTPANSSTARPATSSRTSVPSPRTNSATTSRSAAPSSARSATPARSTSRAIATKPASASPARSSAPASGRTSSVTQAPSRSSGTSSAVSKSSNGRTSVSKRGN